MCGANTFDHGRHIWCTRQYQPKGNDNMRHAKYPSFSTPWWRHDIETLSILLALCRENPLLTRVFPSQRTLNAELRVSIRWYSEGSWEQLVAWVAWRRHQVVDFPSQRPVTGAWMFSLICAWTNGWANNPDAGDFRCHCAHYDITLMDRDFRRRDAHVAAPCWGHDLVLTTQGKCFPNFKTRSCFKRYVLLQWRCMSDRVSDHCQRDFCSRIFFLIYSVRCVTLSFLFAKPVPKTLSA